MATSTFKRDNPANLALSRAVNRAIANGAPVITERPTLACLKARASRAWDTFMTECKSAGFPNEWAAYRAHDAGQKWPAALESAWQASSTATHAFYAARDGAGGFLGSRGL